jgi:succinate dehydrogenase / fumarate reductase, flavoprotein subunit
MVRTVDAQQLPEDSIVSQDILDALTDVKMPRLSPRPPAKEWVTVRGWKIPVRRASVVVVGSGAAGLRAAVELKRRNVDVSVVTQSAYGGTSACSGSDKQTLHTANTSDRGDNFRAMAEAIGAGGAMDQDTAYIEAVGSGRALSSLQFLGLPLPVDSYGGVLRYQTDHDEVGRATSCGPRTSRLMVKVLAQEAIHLGIPVHNQTTAVRILMQGECAKGVLCIVPSSRDESNPHGVVAYLCENLVLAAGGPGELYRDSVYPRNCFGSLGMAMEAGIEAVNLTESQFGIGTSRDGFPWNLSGTYAQCMPYVYSVDDSGLEHNFLADYYRTTQELVSNTFRKGYQWPFHASRMLDFGSSLFDLAVLREMQAGRKVYMDFNRNPVAVPGDQVFDLVRLDSDVRGYLEKSGALLEKPIQRLKKMNPLSIELYKQYKVDIEKHPLLFAMNNQHMNGGIAVDIWGQTSLDGCYAIGEASGTHGVTRPGGAALNSGQVFGTRCAEHIASKKSLSKSDLDIEAIIADGVQHIQHSLQKTSPIKSSTIKREVQARMSDFAGMICRAEHIASALHDAQQLSWNIREHGVSFDDTTFGVTHALQWRQNALASEAILHALNYYVSNGGGSRGARAICDASGESVPITSQGALEDYRFRMERAEDKDEQIVVKCSASEMIITTRKPRKFLQTERPFFERNWPHYLTGAIYQEALNGACNN